MMGSVKLLIATLGVSQFSNVIGTHENAKTREQLRRSLRKGAAQTERERKMQCKLVYSKQQEPRTTSEYQPTHLTHNFFLL